MTALDLQLQEEPSAAALVLYWLAESHQDARGGDGILLPWAMLGLGLVLTDSTRDALPKAKSTLGGWLNTEGARAWRGDIPGAILAWRETFWHAVGRGAQAGMLQLKGGRLVAPTGAKVPAPKTDEATMFRKKSRALGGTFGAEPSDHTITSALGLEFVP